MKNNKLIAEFIGFDPCTDPNHAHDKCYDIRTNSNYTFALSPGYRKSSEMKFESSWDWLMPACNKWDNLYKDDLVLRYRNTDTYAEYIELCNKLDNAVTNYNISDAYLQLVSNIEWYNKQKS